MSGFEMGCGLRWVMGYIMSMFILLSSHEGQGHYSLVQLRFLGLEGALSANK